MTKTTINNNIIKQTKISSGEIKATLELFPSNIKGICSSINKFMLIDLLPNMGIVNVPPEHLNDSNIRGIDDKIKVITDRGVINFDKQREFNNMLLGNCRDLSLVLCTVLKHNKIPARVRSGFATFFHPSKMFDHWVCEYFSNNENRWIKVDPWMSQIQYHKNILPDYLKQGLLSIEYNPYDVDNCFFYTGAEAWLNCRKNNDDFNSYGTYEEELKGEWFVRDNLLRDLLCLLTFEPLPWDCWGKMGRGYHQMSSLELSSLDMLAEHLVKNTITIDLAREVLNNFDMELSDFKLSSF